MNPDIWLSEAAEQSLDDIFNFTFDRWGEAQARQYIGELFAMFEKIAGGEEQGRLIQPRFGVRGRYARCGRHLVYWKPGPDGRIDIAEILHERMNIGDRLAGSPTFRGDN